MVFLIPLEEPSEICIKDIPSQDFHVTHSVQRFIGLNNVEEHLEQRFVAYSFQLLGQIVHQCGRAPPPFQNPYRETWRYMYTLGRAFIILAIIL